MSIFIFAAMTIISRIACDEVTGGLIPHSRIGPGDIGVFQDIWKRGVRMNFKIREMVVHTQRSMLEGENDNISHALKWRRTIWSSKAFRDNNSDAAMDFSSIPMSLLKKLLVKGREA